MACAEATPGSVCGAVYKVMGPYCVHLPILHIGMVIAVTDDEIMLFPLDLEGVAGPGADINGKGRSLKGTVTLPKPML